MINRLMVLVFFMFTRSLWLSGQAVIHPEGDLKILNSILTGHPSSIEKLTDQLDQFIIKNQFNHDSSNALFNEAQNAARKIGDQLRLAWITYYYAEAQSNQLQTGEALLNYKLAQDLFEKAGEQRGIARCQYGSGDVWFKRGNYARATPLIHLAYRGAESTRDTVLMIRSLRRLGFISGEQRDMKRSIAYYRDAIRLAHSTGWISEEVDIMRKLGNTLTETGDIQPALTLLSQADSTLNHRIPGNRYLKAILLTEWGIIEIEKLNRAEAGLAKFIRAQAVFDSLNKYSWSSFLRAVSAQALLKLGKTGKAMNSALDGYQLSVKHHLLKERRDNLEALYHIAKAQKDYQKALEYYSELNLVSDSMISRESIDKIVSMELEFTHEKQKLADSMEFARKEASRKEEQVRKDIQQRTILNSIAAGFAGALIFLVVVYRQRNRISNARKQSDELLLNILPAEVADELKAKGSAEAKHFDEVTVLFTDFKNFTSISEKLTAQELVNEINYCYSAFDHIIMKYKIEKIKTIGDAYMCAGGLPVANPSHAQYVVSAAIEMRNFINDEKQKRMEKGLPFFEIRIGCHSGPVVAGIVGIKKYAYDIWGDTVNIAARMEQNSEAGKINISETTHELVKDKFTCEHRGKISAKNKGEIDMYFVETKN